MCYAMWLKYNALTLMQCLAGLHLWQLRLAKHAMIYGWPWEAGQPIRLRWWCVLRPVRHWQRRRRERPLPRDGSCHTEHHCVTPHPPALTAAHNTPCTEITNSASCITTMAIMQDLLTSKTERQSWRRPHSTPEVDNKLKTQLCYSN